MVLKVYISGLSGNKEVKEKNLNERVENSFSIRIFLHFGWQLMRRIYRMTIYAFLENSCGCAENRV